jgi:hypothetical protein
VSKKATSQHLPQKRQHRITAAKKHLSFIRFGRADPAQAVPKKTTLPIYLATVSAVFVCIFKTRNNGKYVNQLPGCYFKRHEIFKNWLIDYCQHISIIVHACSLTKNKDNACITHWSAIN